MPSPAILRYSDLKTFAQATARAVAGALSAALKVRADAVLAVPGGSTAKIVLPVLSAQSLPWDRIRITLVDERWVPLGHPDSNESLVRASLVGAAANVAVLGLYDGSLSPEAAIAKHVAKLPLPNVVLLGMGEDGHIASLFPNDPANRAMERLAAVARADHPRVTLAPPALVQASACILAFTGPAKEAIFNRALADGPADEFPVRHVLRAGANVFIGP